MSQDLERQEQINKILEPHELSPAMMRHACIAAVGYLTGASIQNKEQMIATLREAVTTPCAKWETFNSLHAEVARLTAENEYILNGNALMLSRNIDLSNQVKSLNRHHQKREEQYEQWLAERTQQLAAAEQQWQARIAKTLKKVEESYLLDNHLHWSEVVNIFGKEFCKGTTHE